ncbi:MAG: 8-oxo-dGTP diphosphatase [Candidatus Diapherotrites archaeon]|nr:8-oxo-dGTP diphosphatase [Candidatus Diapherotrites archaeon]
MKDKTLVYLMDPTNRRVLLGLKKRGFGAGKWNGFGGKVEPNESVITAAVRELKEECGVDVRDSDLIEVGVFDFVTAKHSELSTRVHTFVVLKWTGAPVESEEMAPQWFSFDQLPLQSMWSSDGLWLPLMLFGERLSGTMVFGPDDESVLDYSFDLNGSWMQK